MENRFTLVIPTYNESPIIEATLKTVASTFSSSLVIPWNIIVADNASTDGTADIVEALQDQRIRAVRLREKGRGRAIREGFREARGGIVAFTDVDLSVSPEEIVRALAMILNNECEAVIGTRFAQRHSTLHRSKLRDVSSKAYLLLARLIVGLSASDSQCPLKMMNERTTPIMLATVDPTWFSELEYVALLERLNIAHKEMPVAWDEKRYPARQSKLKFFTDATRAIIAMFKIRYHINAQVRALSLTLSPIP
jgi:glycosyltransferase involved in cell wall biosynthesis